MQDLKLYLRSLMCDVLRVQREQGKGTGKQPINRESNLGSLSFIPESFSPLEILVMKD